MNRNDPTSKVTGQGTKPTVKFNDQLLKGHISGNIVRLGLPIMLTNLIENAYNIVDMIFVGRLGPAALAGVAMGGLLMSLTWTLLVGLMIGTSSFIARFYGAGNEDMVNRVVVQSLILSGIVSLLLVGFGLWGVTPTLKLLGAEGEALTMGRTYSTLVFCFSFNHVLLYVVNAIFRGSGDTRTPMITLGISSVINIILDPLLIFGLGPFPAMGVKGAALATIIGQAVGTGLNLYILYHGISRIRLKEVAFTPDLSVLRAMVKVAIPGSLQVLMTSVAGLVLMRLVTPFGTTAVAAYGIGIRLDIMVMLPGWAMGASVATILGQNLGAGKPDRAERTGWIGTWMYLAMLVPVVIGLQIGAETVIALFSSDPSVIATGSRYIRVVSLGYLCLAFAMIPGMSMNGAGYTVAPMMINFISLICLRIPMALVATRITGNRIEGLFWAITASFLLQAVLSTTWFKKGKWKNKVFV
jgi:putative MATE family efflux protein